VSLRVRRANGQADAPRCELEFEVEDTGIGMSAEEAARLFQPFTQANASISRRFGGTGLGLAISHSLARLMGGSLNVRSTEGQGTCFTLKVTLEERPAPAVELQEVAVSLVSALGLRVLVAEDNVVNQKVVCAFLKTLGCEWEVVPDGRAAVQRLAEQSFDLVLMDCQMPELDGVGATRLIRASQMPYAEIPIVALTANTLIEERQRCAEAGMNGYLTKPIRRNALRDELQRYVKPVSQTRQHVNGGPTP
jgi:two-component system, sensor histidine kinase